MEYNANFETLCAALGLGALRCEPKPLTGGLLHRIYAIETTGGRFAVKTLNPQVMQRPAAKTNILNGERVAALAAWYLPALPAKQFGGTVMPEIDGQYYLVYDWIDGKSLYGDDITPAHCEQIGAILGKLHTIDFSALNIPKPAEIKEEPVNWRAYLHKGQQMNLPWADEYAQNLDNLYSWNQRYLAAAAYLKSPLVVGHGDIDPKNVMWQGGRPVVIDWESAGYLHPMHELLVDALYWSNANGETQRDKFTAFLRGYTSAAPLLDVNWHVVLDAGFSPGWLEYSLKRSLGMESADEAERRMGTDHVFGSIASFQRQDANSNQIMKWLTGGAIHAIG